MSDDDAGVRERHLAQHWLTWTALRHLLPTGVLRDLVHLIVSKISVDTIKLDDLFEERRLSGLPALESWALRALPVNSPTAIYLQRRIQNFLWQTDSDAYPPEKEGDLATDRKDGPIDLEAAVRLGAIDFTVDPRVIRSVRPQVEQSLSVLAELVDIGSSIVRTANVDIFTGRLAQQLESVEAPLGIVMTKHLGDLCADIDEWSKAEVLYGLANERLSTFDEPAWQHYAETLHDIFLQSIATATRVTKGAGQSFVQLHNALEKASLGARPLLSMNAPFDAITARVQIESGLQTTPERRGTLLAPPLYHDAHDLDSVMLCLAHKNFHDAQRACWAVLRRQIALGLASETRTTKAIYGCVVVAMLDEQDQTRAQINDFGLAIRLLVESGDYSNAEKITWSDKLVVAYVDENVVAEVIMVASRYKGSMIERQKVAIELFNSWISLLPDDRRPLANRMVRYIAKCAEESTAAFFANQDLGGRSLELLVGIAERRPELRRSNCDPVQSLILSKLETSTFWQVKRRALELAREYLEVLSERQSEDVIEKTLTMLEGIDPAVQMWPLVRPALQVLVSRPAARLAKEKPTLGKRVLATILRFGTEQSTESSSLIFYLRDFDSALLADASIISSVQPAVETLRKEVAKINSTAVVGQIQALLLSPTISGRKGVDDALNSLERILQSSETSHPSLGLPDAYAAVLMLVDRQDVFASELSIGRSEIDEKWNDIYSAVLNLWSVVKAKPLSIAQFSIPAATRPNPTIIHNWAFASVRIAESLAKKEPMMEALRSAMEQEVLRDPIALALVTGTKADEDVDIAPDKVSSENSSTFYSALGRRLALLPKLDARTARRLCRVLLQQCFRYGPRGLDAAIFVYATQYGLAGQFDPDAGANYLKRVEGNRELRLSLVPLLMNLKLQP
jgi:hypothetical protein